MKFIKKYRKPLGVIALLVVIAVVLFSQVKFLTPDQVVDESIGKITSVVDSITNPDGSSGQSASFSESGDNSSSDSFIADAGSGQNNQNGTGNNIPSGNNSNGTSGNNDNNNGGNGNGGNGNHPSGPTTDNGNYDRKPVTDYIGDNVNRKTGSRYVYLQNQSVNYDKEITVYVSVDCLEALEDGVDCNNSAAWQYVPSDGYIVKKTAVTCYEGENVWDAVARVLNANSLDYAYEGDPPFIHGTESISTAYGSCFLYRCNHLTAGNGSKNEKGSFGNEFAGWTFKVNGVYPGWGMNGVVIRQGDVIELRYYTGYNPFQLDAEGNF